MTRTDNQARSLDLVFAAVADSTRRSMLDRLRDGPLKVTDLARPYAMTLNAASKHIKTLERAGLIRRSISGREHSCQLDASRFDEAMNWMRYHSEFWSGRMDALEQHLTDKRKRGIK